MHNQIKKEMTKAKKHKDWRSYYGLAWLGGLITKCEAERLYTQSHMIIKLEGNYIK